MYLRMIEMASSTAEPRYLELAYFELPLISNENMVPVLT